MAIYGGSTKLKLYAGDSHSVNLYKGDVKFGGWKSETKTGTTITATNTYNDKLDAFEIVAPFSGNLTVNSGAQTMDLPTGYKIGTIADKVYLDNGVMKLEKKISDWINFGDLTFTWGCNVTLPVDGKNFYSPAIYAGCSNLIGTNSDGNALSINNHTTSDSADFVGDRLYIGLLNSKTGFGAGSFNSGELKAFFKGWKMCNTDGSSPYISGTKNWKKITDGTGQTSTLPTSSYAGFTPYKMQYQLATPIISETILAIPKTFYPETTITANGTMSATYKVIDL